MGRSNWHYEHPPACTCVSCVEKRHANRPEGILQMFKWLMFFMRRRKS